MPHVCHRPRLDELDVILDMMDDGSNFFTSSADDTDSTQSVTSEMSL